MFTVLFIDWSSQRLSQVQREGTLISLQRNTEICSATFTEGIQWWRILRSCFKATEFNGNNITTYHLVKATIYLEITLSHHLLSLPFGLSVTSDSAAPWTARSRPGLPVLHHLLEFAQTPVQWFGDAIQPPHSLSPLSPPALNLSQHQGLFQWVSRLFISGGRSVGASASALVFPVNIYGWFPLGFTSLNWVYRMITSLILKEWLLCNYCCLYFVVVVDV